jgi:predicted transposase YdaD
VAIADPELAVLSAMAHGQDDDREKAVRIALAAQLASVNLDEDRSKLYCDLILNSLHEVARQALLTMNPANYEYQSDFARRYVAQGIEEGIERGMEKGIERGKLQGRADLVIRLLGVRFGAISEDIKLRIAAASLTELDAIGERLLSAKTLQEALGQ